MFAYIEHDALELLMHQFPDGSRFRCSESFVRKYLRDLGLSERCSTRAVQKLPDNVHRFSLMPSFDKPASSVTMPFRSPQVNTDQTQPTIKWAGRELGTSEARNKLLPGYGRERGIHFGPIISASGECFQLQTIFFGQTKASCPNKGAHCYTEAESMGLSLNPLAPPLIGQLRPRCSHL